MRTLVLVALLSVAPTSVHADVITGMGPPPSPPSCVRGAAPARPARGHGYYCAAARECTTGTECPSGLCEDTAVCILPGSDGAPYECSEDGSCYSGTCSRARRCIAPPPRPVAPPPPAAAAPASAAPASAAPASAPPVAASSCRAGLTGDASIALLVLGAALLGLSRRRR